MKKMTFDREKSIFLTVKTVGMRPAGSQTNKFETATRIAIGVNVHISCGRLVTSKSMIAWLVQEYIVKKAWPVVVSWTWMDGEWRLPFDKFVGAAIRTLPSFRLRLGRAKVAIDEQAHVNFVLDKIIWYIWKEEGELVIRHKSSFPFMMNGTMKWVELPQHGDVPPPRSSHSITAIGGNVSNQTLILWGGEHSPRVPVSPDTFIYGVETGVWRRIEGAQAPPPRVAHAAAAIETSPHFYIHGGRTQVAEASTLSDLYRFDLGRGSWEEIAPASSATRPCGRNYHAAASMGKNLYIFGGCGNSGRLADLWRFDSGAGTWEELPYNSAIKGRGGAGLVAAGNSVYVIGGFTGQEAGDMHRFDLVSGRWEEISRGGDFDRFTPRSVFGYGVAGSNILMFGGEVDPSDKGHAGAGQFSADTFALDMSNHTLSTMTPWVGQPPCPRGWMASTSLSSQGLVISGGVDNNNARLGDLFILQSD